VAGGTEEKHEKETHSIVHAPGKIQTGHLQNVTACANLIDKYDEFSNILGTTETNHNYIHEENESD
jgi:hypothetical protein